MTSGPRIPRELEAFFGEHSKGDRSTVIALYALICAAREGGGATLNDVAVHYRTDYLKLLREEGKDAETESGRLSLDEVRAHLSNDVFPRLAGEGLITLPEGGIVSPDSILTVAARHWPQLRAIRPALERADVARVIHRGEEITGSREHPVPVVPDGSILEARGLVKTYRKRAVVNDVALHLRQG